MGKTKDPEIFIGLRENVNCCRHKLLTTFSHLCNATQPQPNVGWKSDDCLCAVWQWHLWHFFTQNPKCILKENVLMINVVNM